MPAKWIETGRYWGTLLLQMAAFFLLLLLFATIGVLDAGVARILPAWRTSESMPRWVSRWLVFLVRALFPLLLLVPVSWYRPYRVLGFRYPRKLRPGQRGSAQLTVRNDTAEIWRGDAGQPLRVAVVAPVAGSHFHVPGDWIHATRPAQLAPSAQIHPGQSATFHIPLQAPTRPGTYRETWGLLHEGRGWLPTRRAFELRVVVGEER